MALPVVIVARAGLGTINHTLLTLHAARCAGLRVAGVVINRYRAEPGTEGALASVGGAGRDDDLAILTNPAQIAQRGRVPILALVPEDSRSSVEDARIGTDLQYAIDQVNWQRIIWG